MRFERLGNIVTIGKGKKPTFTESPNENSIRVLQIDDLRNDNNIKYTDEKSGVFAMEEDILLAWDGANAGTIGYGKTGYIGSTIAVLRKRNPTDFSTTFVGKFLQSQSEFLRGKSTGATIPHIDRKSLENLRIPILPISDQLYIATLLSKAENLITQRKQSIALLDEFLKSTFLEMFGDPVKNEMNWQTNRLDKIAKLERGRFSPRPRNDPSYFNGKHPFIQTGDISKSGNRLDSYTQTLNEKGIKVSKEFKKGTIVIAIVGATIGATAICEIDVYATDSIIGIVANKKFTNECFLEFVLRFWKPVLLRIAPEAARANINLEILDKQIFPVPPIELQNKFARTVEKIEVLKAQYQSSLQELENLYNSLSQKAFKGGLTLSKAEEQFLMAAEPEIKYGKEIEFTPKNCNSTERAVLAGHIIKTMNKEDFGRVNFQKLLHLTEYFCRIDIDSNFRKNVAGPHDGELIKDIESILKRYRYYDIKQSCKGNHKVNYTPLSSVDELEDIFKSEFESERERIDAFLAKFRKSSWEQCEIVSTLYAVWNNRLILSQDITDDLLKQDFLYWDKQKVKYQEQLDSSLQWMKENGVIPKGWGKLIE